MGFYFIFNLMEVKYDRGKTAAANLKHRKKLFLKLKMEHRFSLLSEQNEKKNK